MRLYLVILLTSLLTRPLLAQEPAQTADKSIIPISAGQRLALVIGNGDYRTQPPIPQAVNDATDMAATLGALGFQVTLAANTQIGDLDRKLEAFYKTIQPGALALFYYSGHGGSLGEENYLLPIEYQQQETESGVARNAVAISGIRNRMEARGARVRLLVFDACRNASLLATKDAGAGLVEMRGKPEGTLIAYASAHGQVSRFNPKARNSYYTGALLERLRAPRADLRTLLEETADTVYTRTGESQMPYLYGRLFGKLYLGKTPDSAVTAPDAAARVWALIEKSENPQDFDEFALAYPKSDYVPGAKLRAAQLRRASVATPPAVIAPVLNPGQPSEDRRRVNPKDGLTYVWVPSGRFRMGCSAGDKECYPDEKPEKEVEIKKGLWIGQTEVTQAAYERVIGSNPSEFKGGKLPVENVSWLEAGAYCGKVGMRLPTEAEWEYAARAGSESARYGSVDAIAWYGGNSGAKTHEVGGKEPNVWGLYDMLGNVWEWTSDWYEKGKSRTLRGGSWYVNVRLTRVSYRFRLEPDYRFNDIGFRCIGE